MNYLLEWSRTQSDNIPFEPKKVNFIDVCQEIVENLHTNATAKSINIKYFTTDVNEVFVDINMFQTVLRNLVSNAIKFSNNNGKIHIYAIKDAADVIITVSDNGIGIAKNNIEKLFDITQKQSTSGTADERGTGLGLIICKEFVEKHKGKIWVESELGKGSDFKFTIPFYKG